MTAPGGGWQALLGWFNYANIYDELVATSRDGDTIVEVGVAVGRSVAYLARRVIESGKRVRIVAVDPWDIWNDDAGHPLRATPSDEDVMGWHGRHAELWREHGSTFRTFLGEMRKHAPEELDRICVVRAYSAEAARMFASGSLHAVWIDADHSYDGVRTDIAAWRSKVRPTTAARPAGHFAGHDHHRDVCAGLVQAVEEALGPEGTGYRVQGTSWREIRS